MQRRLDLLPSSPFYPTASELHRAAECVAPWALGLPEAEDAPGEWAEFGRRMHWGAELLAHGQGMIDTLSRILPEPNGDAQNQSSMQMTLEHVEHAIAADIDGAQLEHTTQRLRDTAWLVEQGVAWRPSFPVDEAKLLRREPGARLRGWFSGTADLTYVRADGVLVVVDWKFGPSTARLGEPAEDHAQLWTLALALSTALGIRGSGPSVVVARVEIRHVREDGIEVDGHDLTQGDIDAWADTLRGLARRIDTATDAAPKLSAACGKCRAKDGCPAWNALETAILDTVCNQGADAFIRPPMGPEDVRALYHATEAAESAVENWRLWTQAYCLTHPEGVDIGLGLKLQAKERASRAVVQTSEAMDLIERVAGSAAIEVKRKSSIGAIEKAVREAAGAGIVSKSDRDKAKKRVAEEAITRLVKGGAIQEKGSRWGVSIVRSDGTETVWMKGIEDE